MTKCYELLQIAFYKCDIIGSIEKNIQLKVD